MQFPSEFPRLKMKNQGVSSRFAEQLAWAKPRVILLPPKLVTLSAPGKKPGRVTRPGAPLQDDDRDARNNRGQENPGLPAHPRHAGGNR